MVRSIAKRAGRRDGIYERAAARGLFSLDHSSQANQPLQGGLQSERRARGGTRGGTGRLQSLRRGCRLVGAEVRAQEIVTTPLRRYGFVLCHVPVEVFREFGLKGAARFLAALQRFVLDFKNGQQIARGGGDEHFIRSFQILGRQRFFPDGVSRHVDFGKEQLPRHTRRSEERR